MERLRSSCGGVANFVNQIISLVTLRSMRGRDIRGFKKSPPPQNFVGSPKACAHISN